MENGIVNQFCIIVTFDDRAIYDELLTRTYA